MNVGVLAGYPMVGVKAILLDGASHDVDRPNWRSRSPVRWASRRPSRKANPTILEPIMAVEVRTPEEYMGDVIGDLNSRRARSSRWKTLPRQGRACQRPAVRDVRLHR